MYILYVRETKEQERTNEMNNTTAPIRNPKDVEKLLKLAKKDSKPVYNYIRVALYTALRSSDILALTPKNVNGGYMHIIAKKTGKPFVYDISSLKNVIDLTASYLIHGQKADRPLSVSYVNQKLKEYGEKLNIEISTHSLRKTVAYQLYMNGLPIDRISELLQHDTIETTRRYLMFDNSEITNGLNAVNSLWLS